MLDNVGGSMHNIRKLERRQRASKIKFNVRRVKRLFSKSPYFKADDIRQVGKTTMLLKCACKTPSSLIITNSVKHRDCLVLRIQEQFASINPVNAPRVVALSKLTRDDFKYARNVFIEEPMDRYDIAKITKLAQGYTHKIKLSFAPLD